jgi:hypothetical protein
MPSRAQTHSFRLIERLFGERIVAGYSDGELLERFTAKRDPDVFAALAARHGRADDECGERYSGPGRS